MKQIAEGELIEKQEGEKDGSHAAIVEGYDFDKKCLICKNSWGSKTAAPRFNLKPSATHSYYFTHVYFTLSSIKGKTNKTFKPKMNKFVGYLDNRVIDCAWMDEKTAIYSSDYVCELHEEKEGPYNYLGYDIKKWIRIKLIPPELDNLLILSSSCNNAISFIFSVFAALLFEKPYNLLN